MADLDEVVRSAVGVDGIESEAVFVVAPGSPELQLGAAAAVADPAHPIRRSMADDGPTFDVRPMNPGGPALRSHLPLLVEHDGRSDAVGVLALAHHDPPEPCRGSDCRCSIWLPRICGTARRRRQAQDPVSGRL